MGSIYSINEKILGVVSGLCLFFLALTSQRQVDCEASLVYVASSGNIVRWVVQMIVFF